jgi:hypothetical protein
MMMDTSPPAVDSLVTLHMMANDPTADSLVSLPMLPVSLFIVIVCHWGQDNLLMFTAGINEFQQLLPKPFPSRTFIT